MSNTRLLYIYYSRADLRWIFFSFSFNRSHDVSFWWVTQSYDHIYAPPLSSKPITSFKQWSKVVSNRKLKICQFVSTTALVHGSLLLRLQYKATGSINVSHAPAVYGFSALVTMFVMGLTGWRVFRQRFYQTFLATHILGYVFDALLSL